MRWGNGPGVSSACKKARVRKYSVRKSGSNLSKRLIDTYRKHLVKVIALKDVLPVTELTLSHRVIKCLMATFCFVCYKTVHFYLY
uniref:Uncharacterized protein n=1 Tax=Anguilla anguilla TaxID=7936 RepID=A0A0E9WDZ5_ANGAN